MSPPLTAGVRVYKTLVTRGATNSTPPTVTTTKVCVDLLQPVFSAFSLCALWCGVFWWVIEDGSSFIWGPL